MKFINPILFIVLLFGFSWVYGQDTTNKPVVKTESSDTVSHDKIYPNPRHVALESTLCPGLGQITNGQWYKTPILYAGLGTMIYFIVFNEQQFSFYRNNYVRMQNGDTQKIGGYVYTPDELESYISYYRQNRDLLVICTAAVYIVNIFDAYVFAHLRSFDVSNDLSLKIEPINFSNIANRNVLTCSIKFNFRK